MEHHSIKLEMLDLMIQPVFVVQNDIITKVNPPAAQLLVREGMDIRRLMVTGLEAYHSFSGGCLFTTLRVYGTEWGASVIRIEDGDLFCIDQPFDSPELRILSLAAKELRTPLSDALIDAQRITADLADSQRETAARLNQRLYQLLRIVSNMSDAPGFSTPKAQELRNMDALFREIFEKAAVLAEAAGVMLTYEGLDEDVLSLADSQILERAALNLVSNALHYTDVGGKIRVSLTSDGRFLQLRVSDNGSGIPEDLRASVFQRYLRNPSLEDNRQGIGLGMLLVRSAASCHGGAILIDHPEEQGTRVTMTLAIRKGTDQVREIPLRIDYTGERDHALVELSDCLPYASFLDL